MQPHIHTISALLSALEGGPSGTTHYLSILKSLKIPTAQFERHFHWRSDRPCRVGLARTEAYELVLICWEANQTTPIHHYDTNEAWIHPLEGHLKEERFIRGSQGTGVEKVSEVMLGSTEVSYMNANMNLHRFSNQYSQRSVSLHLYAKPIDYWREFQEASYTFGIRKVGYDYEEHLQQQCAV